MICSNFLVIKENHAKNVAELILDHWTNVFVILIRRPKTSFTCPHHHPLPWMKVSNSAWPVSWPGKLFALVDKTRRFSLGPGVLLLLSVCLVVCFWGWRSLELSEKGRQKEVFLAWCITRPFLGSIQIELHLSGCKKAKWPMDLIWWIFNDLYTFSNLTVVCGCTCLLWKCWQAIPPVVLSPHPGLQNKRQAATYSTFNSSSHWCWHMAIAQQLDSVAFFAN